MDITELIEKNTGRLKENETKLLSVVAKYDAELARRIQNLIYNVEKIDLTNIAEVEKIILNEKLNVLVASLDAFYQYSAQEYYRLSLQSRISDLEESVNHINNNKKEGAESQEDKEVKNKVESYDKIMHFSNLFTSEFKQLENKYFWTGVVWEILAVIAFGSIFVVFFFYKPEPVALSDSMQKIFSNSFTSSIFVLAPIFVKAGVVILLATISGICMKLYGDYKRLAQEYRQKLLLANTLFNGHEIIKVYVGDNIDTAFVLPMVEQILEDPLKKVYSKQESKEDALGLVEKIMELSKAGKELGGKKAKRD